ncbi:tRNA(His) guanylyltransferase [Megavirus baoshan]|uniref:tRNA(His) guanylyltransferase n=2 Tax=Megavirus baoshan TaxID=2496520 RepID=A0A8K1T2S6_9VIRU|nr:tRNA(His) guanylyltransferase [Megavirus baoshan]UFX99844.1 tRNA(His) guanylyltransferase [Megavirus baoshan]
MDYHYDFHNIIMSQIEPTKTGVDKRLGDRMKYNETLNENIISKNDYFCIRLDGHSFSKFTAKLQKPFDKNFSKAMILAASDAMIEFSARTAFTQSDEITLVFDNAFPKDIENIDTDKYTHIYSGRILKLVSLSASFVSTRFNYHLNNLVEKYIINSPNIYNPKTIDNIKNFRATFDARILIFDENNKCEMLNHLIWRCQDGYRNSIQMYAHHHFGPAKINKLKGMEMIDLLEKENKLQWKDIPLWHKYGTIIKKILVDFETTNGMSKRTQIKQIAFKINYSDNILNFIFDKYFDIEKLQNITYESVDI